MQNELVLKFEIRSKMPSIELAEKAEKALTKLGKGDPTESAVTGQILRTERMLSMTVDKDKAIADLRAELATMGTEAHKATCYVCDHLLTDRRAYKGGASGCYGLEIIDEKGTMATEEDI